MSDELLPCPFCGGKARMYTTESVQSYRRGVVKCTTCGAEVRAEGGGHAEFNGKTNDEARALSQQAAKAKVVAAWNRRAS